MRLSKAVRFPRRVTTLSAILLAGTSVSRAQFSGGTGDGYAQDGVRFVALDGRSLDSPAYTASTSGGDGYDVRGQAYVRLDGTTLPVQPYTASSTGGDGYDVQESPFNRIDGTAQLLAPFTASVSGGDGYDYARLSYATLNGAVTLTAVFKGGTGDGYDTLGLANTALSPSAAFQLIYAGGTGDGYDESGAQFVPLGGITPEIAAIYSASSSGGDGYDRNGVLFSALNGVAIPEAPFTASTSGGDGYDVSRAPFIAVSGESFSAVTFLGGEGDGYDRNGLQFANLNGLPVLADLYLGGSGDGYDEEALPFVQYLGGGTGAAAITYSGWISSRYTAAEIEAGLAAPDADTDADGLVNLLEFALGSDPRVADAAVFAPQFRLSNLSELGLPALPDRHLTAIVRRNPLALDATLKVEVTEDPAGFWSTGDTIQVDASPSVIIVRDEFGISSAPRRIMRLRATLNQNP